MPIQSWQSNPNLSSTLEADNPKNLKLIFPPKLHSPLLLQRSSSLGNNPNCPDDFEHFYTPRATFKTNEKSVVPQILHSSENATERLSKTFEIAKRKSKLSTFRRKKHEKYLRRFGTSSPFKHHDARELLRSAKRRLKKITEDQAHALTTATLFAFQRKKRTDTKRILTY